MFKNLFFKFRNQISVIPDNKTKRALQLCVGAKVTPQKDKPETIVYTP